MFVRPIATSNTASGLYDREVPKLCLPPLVPSYPARGFASVALATGAAEIADLPGPAAGFVRIYESVSITASALASTLTDVTTALRSGGVSYPVKVATTSTATIVVSPVPALGNGEVLRVTNGGANAGRVVGTYVDVPATGITLVRTALDATGVSVIPAAPTGYGLRFLQREVGDPSIVVSNLDAVTHSFEVLVGSTVVTRSAPVLTLAVGALAGPTAIPVTDTVLKVRLAAAVDTTAPVILAAYEAYPV